MNSTCISSPRPSGSDALLVTGERRDPAADDRAFDVRQTVAPDGAAMAGV
jgi:hypothetical protein